MTSSPTDDKLLLLLSASSLLVMSGLVACCPALMACTEDAGRLCISAGLAARATVFNGARNSTFDRVLQDQRGTNGLESTPTIGGPC